MTQQEQAAERVLNELIRSNKVAGFVNVPLDLQRQLALVLIDAGYAAGVAWERESG